MVKKDENIRNTGKNLKSKFCVGGFIFGLFFPIIGIIVEIYYFNLDLSIKSIIKVHSNPLIYIIDLAPIILGATASLIARFFQKSTNKIFVYFDADVKEKNNQFSIIEKLIDENLDFEININYENTDNANTEILESLLKLQTKLKNNKSALEKIKIEEQQRSWANIGIAKFGEILRNDNEDLKKLSYNVISNLVKYLEANQGGLFLLNETDEKEKFFELQASIAFDRQKFNTKRINWGEGLIGACALDKQNIFLTDIPSEYVEITSGLGDANPKCILLVPLLLNDKVYGIIELASFKILQAFEVDFVEKLGEIIASTISSVQININTNILLKQTQEQTNRMEQQEEEMRQNLEELQATQEDAAKNQRELSEFVDVIDENLIRIEFNNKGIISYANDKCANNLGYNSADDIESKSITTFVSDNDKAIINDLLNGKHYYEGNLNLTKENGDSQKTIATVATETDEMNEIYKYIILAIKQK